MPLRELMGKFNFAEITTEEPGGYFDDIKLSPEELSAIMEEFRTEHSEIQTRLESGEINHVEAGNLKIELIDRLKNKYLNAE